MSNAREVDALTQVAQMLRNCGTEAGVLPASALYNEGWMLRLVLQWFAGQRDVVQHPFQFLPRARWYSEALLASQFLPRTRGDLLGESWTHADGVIGHFDIAPGRGDVKLNADAKQLVVVEAKMFSPLSGGTKRALLFDQVARNVACIAETVHRSGQPPSSLDRLGFVVIAPAEQINSGIFGQLCEKESIAAKVADRVLAYESAKDDWHASVFDPVLKRLDVSLLAWEEALDTIATHDRAASNSLRAFYDQCLRVGRPRQQ